MSDSEFEKYLAILCGLLRLDPRHRDEIAAELRDHLEERLGELLARGYSRHKAIIIALEEFGDAAGLAGDFLQVVRRQRRRWFMKMTAGSLAVCVCVAMAVVALLPEGSRNSGGSRLIAQEQGSPTGTVSNRGEDPFGPAATGPIGIPGAVPENAGAGAFPNPELASGQAGGAGQTPPGTPAATPQQPQPTEAEMTMERNNALAEEKLAKRMPAEYLQVPFQEMLESFSRERGVEIYVNRKKLDETGISLDATIENIEFKSIRGDMLLDLVLRELSLVYTIRDGIVVITSPDDLEGTLELRVYNCSDLVALQYHSGGTANGQAGMGEGSSMMPGTMPGMTGGMGMPGMPGMSGAGGGMAMQGMPGMPGMSGMPGMGGAGMGMAAPGGMGGMMGSMGSGTSAPDGGPPRVNHLDALIHVITSTVLPDSWQEVGGNGTIQAYHGGLLIVNNNPQAHRKVEQLLKMMRNAAQQPPGSVVSGR